MTQRRTALPRLFSSSSKSRATSGFAGDDFDAAVAVTNDTSRRIRIPSYFWAPAGDALVYSQNVGGDDDFHLFLVDTPRIAN
jgi:hypothetical protein